MNNNIAKQLQETLADIIRQNEEINRIIEKFDYPCDMKVVRGGRKKSPPFDLKKLNSNLYKK